MEEGYVKDIVSSMPKWLFRTGLATIVFFSLCLITVSSIIKYPDVIIARSIITSDPAPFVLKAKTFGPIKYLKNEGDTVNRNEAVAYVQSSVSYQDILLLKEHLRYHNNETLNDYRQLEKYISEFPANLHIGEIQTEYEEYLVVLKVWLEEALTTHHEEEIENFRGTISKYNSLSSILKNQIKIHAEEISIEKQEFLIDSSLYAQSTNSLLDFYQRKKSYLRKQRENEMAQASLLNNELQIRSVETTILKLEDERIHELQKLRIALETNYRKLSNKIEVWRNINVFTSLQAGRINYSSTIKDNDYARPNDLVATIITDNRNIICKAQAPMYRSGEIHKGQTVVIKLNGFPYQEFGTLKGEIEYITDIPQDSVYNIRIRLPDGLKTDFNKPVEFKQEMTAVSEIITNDKSIIKRIFTPRW